MGEREREGERARERERRVRERERGREREREGERGERERESRSFVSAFLLSSLESLQKNDANNNAKLTINDIKLYTQRTKHHLYKASTKEKKS